MTDYKLQKQHFELLRWLLVKFRKGKFEEREGFYWVPYSLIMSRFGIDRTQTQNRLNRLCGYSKGKYVNGTSIYPLSKKIFQTSKGKRVYFQMNSESYIYEEEKKMRPLKLVEPPTVVKVSTPDALKLLNKLLSVQQKDGGNLFTNRLPKNGKTTAVLEKAQKKLLAVYNGKFSKLYQVSPEYLNRNTALINQETWKKLKKVQGSWEATEKLLTEAANNYKKWFWPEKEPETKDWLTQEISHWLFDEYTERSLFLACILREPYPLKDLAADRLYDTISSKVRERAEEVYQPEWDQVGYWSKIRDIVAFYHKLKKKEAREPNLKYWLDGLSTWFDNYIDWLNDLTDGGIYFKNLGINCPTWTAWCTFGAKQHHFSTKVFKN